MPVKSALVHFCYLKNKEPFGELLKLNNLNI